MQRFLESCASFIYDRFSGSFRETCIVFPNRRSGVFFLSYLKKKLTKPVIGPRITTIHDLLSSFSKLMPADRLKLNALLYETYREHTGTTESFDNFYFWGEILLSDFDEIDKYLVNAADLFRNLSQLKDLERRFDYLSEEQKKMLEQFWGTLKNWQEFEQEKDFITIWEKLSAIYFGFREKLTREGIGYDGMVIRDAMERVTGGLVEPEFDRYLFVGLNALNPCEKKSLIFLKKNDRSLFFWDYDNFYLSDIANNAGKFIRENLEIFPAPGDFYFDFNQFVNPKNIELTGVPSGFGQAQIIPRFLKERGPGQTDHFDDTAVVLADESLLFPVLGALPEEIGSVNVTMGYPLRNSPVVSFLLMITELLKNTNIEEGREPRLYFRLVDDILHHRMLSGIEAEKVDFRIKEMRTGNKVYVSPSELFFSELHRQIFSLPRALRDYTRYFLQILVTLHDLSTEKKDYFIVRETISHIYSAIEKLGLIVHEIMLSGKIEISPLIYFRLMRQYINQLSVPYEGEPLSGIQVMGILETRCLDFDNLLIIGLNEEIWPRSPSLPSMIPFSLKKSFGLPGPDEQDAMYAYYFYRLIQRSRHIVISWNTVREALSGGELSRFGFQLILFSPHHIVRKNQQLTLSGIPVQPLSIHSTPAISNYLFEVNQTGNPLSPSAIISYITCSLRFYFRYVAGLKEPEEVVEEIDRLTFGNIFHKAVEILYQSCIGKWVDREDIGILLRDKELIKRCIRQAFASEYFHREPGEWEKVAIEGKAILIFSALETYIKNLLETDMETAPVFIHHLEKNFETSLQVTVDGIPGKIRVGGKIDRVDETDGVVRLIDYKTGFVDKYATSFQSVKDLFDRSKKQVKKESIQALVYSYILKRACFPGKLIQPAIFAVLKLKDESFIPQVRMKGLAVEISKVQEELETSLKELLSEIYSVETTFSQTPETERCRICPYSTICRRW